MSDNIQTYEGLSEDAKEAVLKDLQAFVEHVKRTLADGTFDAAFFSVAADDVPEDGSPVTQIHVWGYRHGYESATELLLNDINERYAASMGLNTPEGSGHAH